MYTAAVFVRKNSRNFANQTIDKTSTRPDLILAKQNPDLDIYQPIYTVDGAITRQIYIIWVIEYTGGCQAYADTPHLQLTPCSALEQATTREEKDWIEAMEISLSNQDIYVWALLIGWAIYLGFRVANPEKFQPVEDSLLDHHYRYRLRALQAACEEALPPPADSGGTDRSRENTP